jgi:hypothetical protein
MVAKRLVDLYVIGEEVIFEDPSGGDDIVVYLKKLQPFEQEVAMNRANVQRAKVLTLKKLPPGDEALLPFDLQLDDSFTDEEIATFVSAEDVQKAYRSAEAMVSEKEEWTNDDYLVGLQEAWEELKEHYFLEEDPEKHTDALRVFGQLKIFSEQVDEEFERGRKRVELEYSRKPKEELRLAARDKLIEMKADMKWINEFKRSQIWQATRDPAKKKDLYFSSRSEIDELSEPVLQRLLDVYEAISVRPDEGKDLRATQSS